MLDRLGGEKARATSIVRYAPDSQFSPHFHPGGEEVLVLSGTFSEGDEHYPSSPTRPHVGCDPVAAAGGAAPGSAAA